MFLVEEDGKKVRWISPAVAANPGGESNGDERRRRRRLPCFRSLRSTKQTKIEQKERRSRVVLFLFRLFIFSFKRRPRISQIHRKQKQSRCSVEKHPSALLFFHSLRASDFFLASISLSSSHLFVSSTPTAPNLSSSASRSPSGPARSSPQSAPPLRTSPT